jgi:mono/diheme cytochrome c family protein
MTRVAQYVTATIPALAILGFFVWFANWIPQTAWEPPQKQEITAAMTPAQLAVVGETIVRERGCMACHTIEPGAGVQGGGAGSQLG